MTFSIFCTTFSRRDEDQEPLPDYCRGTEDGKEWSERRPRIRRCFLTVGPANPRGPSTCHLENLHSSPRTGNLRFPISTEIARIQRLGLPWSNKSCSYSKSPVPPVFTFNVLVQPPNKKKDCTTQHSNLGLSQTARVGIHLVRAGESKRSSGSWNAEDPRSPVGRADRA
ncbi:hypothetical protein BJX63DRAFT_49641 [Aspergillus granulosus]|uniref:Uncharacterized protein n=1 Tax=Aspergillus granulosus TaxID=176169 RepID=A0ABR4GY78_9EURO